MPKVKTSVASHKRKKRVLKSMKGAWGGRSKLYRRAKETSQRSLVFAYRDRKAKKRFFRRLWVLRINAAAREEGLTYSQFMRGLSQADINLDRKSLADLAVNDQGAFAELAKIAKKTNKK